MRGTAYAELECFVAVARQSSFAKAARALVKKAMETVHPLDVPLIADLNQGPNWRDAK